MALFLVELEMDDDSSNYPKYIRGCREFIHEQLNFSGSCVKIEEMELEHLEALYASAYLSGYTTMTKMIRKEIEARGGK